VEKHCRAREATDDYMARRMRFACCITKTASPHSEYVIPIIFYGNNGYTNAP